MGYFNLQITFLLAKNTFFCQKLIYTKLLPNYFFEILFMSTSEKSSPISVFFLTVLFLLLLALLALVVAQFYASDEYKPSYFIPKYTGITLPDQFSSYFVQDKNDSLVQNISQNTISSQLSSSIVAPNNDLQPAITSGSITSNSSIATSQSNVSSKSTLISSTSNSLSLQNTQPTQSFVYSKTNSLLSLENGLVTVFVEPPVDGFKDELQVCASRESDKQVFCTANFKNTNGKFKYVLELEEGDYKLYSTFTKTVGNYLENLTTYQTQNNSQSQFQVKKGEEVNLGTMTKASFEKALQESKQTQK
jgi:hypothetical protein